MGQGQNVDSRALEGLLRQVANETFSITYSAGKIAHIGVVEPIHRPFNKKMLAQPSGEIISFTERSGRRLHLAVLREIGGGGVHAWVGLTLGIISMYCRSRMKSPTTIYGLSSKRPWFHTFKAIPREM